MSKKMPALRLGLFVFLGMVLIVVAVFLIGQKESLFTSTFQVKAYFHDIQGLRSGASVRLSGIDVGSVSDVHIVNDTTGRVEVTLNLSSDIQRFIRTDTKATIETEGLVGNKVVVLKIGSTAAEPVHQGGVIKTEEPIGFSAIVAQTEGIMNYTREMTKNLSEIVARVNHGEGTIGKLLNDEQLYDNATQLTKRADESLTSITKELNRVTGLFDTLGVGVKDVVNNVNKVVTDADTIIYGLSQGKGVLGGLIVQNSPYDSIMTSTLENVKKTAADARLASSRLAENMEALKHNWLFKGYFENRGYWDKAEYEDEISSRMKILDAKIKMLNERILKLQKLEKKTSSK